MSQLLQVSWTIDAISRSLHSDVSSIIIYFQIYPLLMISLICIIWETSMSCVEPETWSRKLSLASRSIRRTGFMYSRESRSTRILSYLKISVIYFRIKFKVLGFIQFYNLLDSWFLLICYRNIFAMVYFLLLKWHFCTIELGTTSWTWFKLINYEFMLSFCLGYLKGWTSSDEYQNDIQESDDTDFYSWVKNWIQKWRSDTG